MKKHMQRNGELSSLPTCANCIHTFRKKELHDFVVCVPHLTTMPADHSEVCDLYERRSPQSLN